MSLLNHPSRRRFLGLLAASPVLPFLDLPSEWSDAIRLLVPGRLEAAQAAAVQDPGALITTAAQAASVFDFEALAQSKLPPWHWAWLSGGGDDGGTIRANRDAFSNYQVRVRRLINVSKVDSSVQLLGKTWETPIFLCPVSGHRMYNPQGELVTARAAKAKRHLQILSTMTTTSVEDVNEARGEPVWYQLYHRNDWLQNKQLLKRVEAAGCPALVFTIDILGGRNLEQFNRAQRRYQQQCSACHLNGQPFADQSRRPMLSALTAPEKPEPEVGTPTWDYVKRLRDATSMKLFLKGIVTREDAELAVQHGVSGVYVSNHGGRAENSLRPTIQCVSDVAAGAAGRIPVMVDGGFRRGTDIFKALALGATGVGVGRPYIWGLSAFGQEGVETVLELLRRELQLFMRQVGTTSIKGITRNHLIQNNLWK